MSFPPPPSELGLKKFTMRPKHGGDDIVIHAKSKKQAWCKFCTQRFGALKPSCDDWDVIETPA